MAESLTRGLADRLALVMSVPERFAKPNRAPRSGDLIVLASTLDPRVRVALEVVPSGTSDKITVLDPKDENGERQFLATHVTYAAWWEWEAAANRVARAGEPW